MDSKTRIAEALDQILTESNNLFLVELKFSSSKANGKVTIVLDGDEGVAIEDCAMVSRRLGHLMEEENLIDDAYTLEVTSAGADAPLKFLRQYNRHIGRRLKVEMQDGTVHAGELTEVKEDRLLLNNEVKDKKKKITLVPVEIPLAAIKSAHVEVSFK